MASQMQGSSTGRFDAGIEAQRDEESVSIDARLCGC
jgi:hypothetical protein